jgi:hypothetical protein
MSPREVVQHLQACIEASVYVAPTEPGLTVAELYEIGERLGLKKGEINDALPQVATQYSPGTERRLLLSGHLWQMYGNLVFGEEPDLRDPAAFDFVVSQLNEVVREMGSAKVCLDRSVVLERAQAQSISRQHVEVAITLMQLAGRLVEENGVLRFTAQRGGVQPLPSTGISPAIERPRHLKSVRTDVMPHVTDVIERRVDIRPQSIEPLVAFAEQLEKLGYGHFRLWWNQTVAELGRTDLVSSPLSALVLAAALVEGALTFVVKHARSLNLGALGSTDFEKDPQTWKLDDLLKGSTRGGDAAILNPQTKNRADGLLLSRQRIHAGRMISEFPKGVPDLRPEEAREGKAVAEQVVRRVLDWLEKYPPS